MKSTFNFYKSYYYKIRIIDLIPIISYSKNVQGWFFTRCWSINWLTYAISFSLIKISDLNQDRNISHEKNVIRYM